ncbi:MAG: B12-binding domain-containing radical SAM protein, partial [Deltaproteobacteria bacterium]
FIPKPHTPFQWVAQNSLAESFEKLKYVRKNLNLPGINLKWQNPQVSILEGLWSRGDRRLSRLLVTAYDKGCRFDGWSDKFRFDAWMEACAQIGCDIDFYTLRGRDIFEPLPWDHVDTKVEKSFLRQEWSRALKCELTHDCRSGDCNSCGVCVFKFVAPEIFQICDKVPVKSENIRNCSETVYIHYTVSYSKTDQAKYWGHLEMVKIF